MYIGISQIVKYLFCDTGKNRARPMGCESFPDTLTANKR
jgi:hypothetical protein